MYNYISAVYNLGSSNRVQCSKSVLVKPTLSGKNELKNPSLTAINSNKVNVRDNSTSVTSFLKFVTKYAFERSIVPYANSDKPHPQRSQQTTAFLPTTESYLDKTTPCHAIARTRAGLRQQT